MKPTLTLRRKIRQWSEANEPTRAVECAVKPWNFLERSPKDTRRKAWLDKGFAAILERINENEQNK